MSNIIYILQDMRRFPICKLLIILCFSFLAIYLYSLSTVRKKSHNNKELIELKPRLMNTNTDKYHITKRIVMSFVVCDSRFNESLNVIKSVLIFTKTPVYFVIFADDNLQDLFNDTLTKWKSLVRGQLDFEVQKITFPEALKDDWMNLFSKCAAQRLFIPKLVSHIDAMIYVDTDTLFLGPADELWDVFALFNTSQISAMALEDDNPNVSWYPRFAKHPFYGKFGLNSGVMLMNLTRMRDFGWTEYVTPIMLKWKPYIPWGDQDIINIIFHYHERAVYVLSCRYNYRSDQCMYGDACSDATDHGVFVLHGSRGIFHNNKQPAFQHIQETLLCSGSKGSVIQFHLGNKTRSQQSNVYHCLAIYQAISEYEIGTDPIQVILNTDKYFSLSSPSNCGNLKEAFIKVPVATLQNLYAKPNR